MVLSASKEILLELLRRWPRSAVSKALETYAYQEAALLDGSVSRLLSEQAAERSSIPPPKLSSDSVGFFEPEFPAVLRHIPDPPLLLYYRGELAALGDVERALFPRQSEDFIQAGGEEVVVGLGPRFVDAGDEEDIAMACADRDATVG